MNEQKKRSDYEEQRIRALVDEGFCPADVLAAAEQFERENPYDPRRFGTDIDALISKFYDGVAAILRDGRLQMDPKHREVLEKCGWEVVTEFPLVIVTKDDKGVERGRAERFAARIVLDSCKVNLAKSAILELIRGRK